MKIDEYKAYVKYLERIKEYVDEVLYTSTAVAVDIDGDIDKATEFQLIASYENIEFTINNVDKWVSEEV